MRNYASVRCAGVGVFLLLMAALSPMPALAEGQAEAGSGGGKVWIDGPAEVPAGGQVKISFEAPETFAANAWIGVVPSSVPHGDESVNDQHDTYYEQLKKRTSGTVVLTVPETPGSYDARMHDTDDGGKEVASVTFTVVAAAGSVSVDKAEYLPGEPMKVTFKAPAGLEPKAWAGLIPSSVPHGNESENDKHDVHYEYLNGRTEGVLEWQAPGSGGQWDVRLHTSDSNGVEIAHVGFTVKGATGEVKIDKTGYAPGETITVQFSSSIPLASNAWIGIIPSNIPHGKEADGDANDLTYQHLNGKTEGSLTFTAPAAPGSYDIRMYDTDSSGNELDSKTFTVK